MIDILKQGAVKWLAYCIYILIVVILQEMFFNHFPIFGSTPVLIPAAVACVALFDGAETGAVFGLISGIVWDGLSPESSGAYIVLLTLTGIIIGAYGGHIFSTSLSSSFLLSVLAIICCEGMIYLLNFVAGTAGIRALWLVLLPEVLYSVILNPLVIWMCRFIYGRLGDNK